MVGLIISAKGRYALPPLYKEETMTKTEIMTWVATEFLPLEIATPRDTISQIIDNAMRYWNTHSAFKTVEMYTFANADVRVQLDAKFKLVARVYPSAISTWIWQGQPLWTLLGIQVMDNVTMDMIVLGEAFKNYRSYIGTDFRWKFVASEDPTVGGYLYLQNLPSGATHICVEGAKRITRIEDATSEHILNWLLYYIKSLVKQVEGNTLRKSSIIGVSNDGQELMNEGKDEMKELQDQVQKEGRWFSFARRSAG